MYQHGRDKRLRPIVVIDFNKMDAKKITINDLQVALEFMMFVVRRHMLVPRYIERWIVVIDMANMALWKIDLQIAKSLILTSSLNFTGCMHRMYLCNVSRSCMIAYNALKSRWKFFIQKRRKMLNFQFFIFF